MTMLDFIAIDRSGKNVQAYIWKKATKDGVPHSEYNYQEI